MNRKKWLQKIATFMLAGTLILQPASISSMSLMPMTVAAAESGNQGEVEKEEEKKAPDKGNASEEKKNAAAGKDTDDKKSDDSGQSGESASKTESDSAGQKNEDKEQSSSSDVKKEEKEKKEGEEKEAGTENKEEAEKKEETEKEKEEKQKDKDEKKEEKEDKKEDTKEKDKNSEEKKAEENDSAVDAEDSAKDAGQDNKKEEKKEEEENRDADKAEKAAGDGKTGENTAGTEESQNALERLGETIEKTILQAPLLKANNEKTLQIRIIPNNAEVPYDGKEHIVQNFTIYYKVNHGEETTTAPEGVSVELKDNKARKETEAGTYTFTLSKDQFEFKISDDYKFNHGNALNISTEVKSLKIKQATCSVTITGKTNSLPYNGKEQSVSGYTIELSKGAPIGKDDISGPEQSAAVAKGTNANGGTNDDKTYPMGLQASAFSYLGNSNNCDVTFHVTDGWLKITPAPLTVKIKGKTLTRVYNGTNKESIDGYDFDIPDGVKFEGSEIICDPFPVAEGIDVKYDKDKNIVSYPMGLTVSNFSTDNTNYNVTFEVEDGWLMIEPLEVTVNTVGGEKEYDGTPLTMNDLLEDWYPTGGAYGVGPFPGEMDISITGEQTDVGSSDNSCQLAWNEGKTPDNYIIHYNLGKLVVTPKHVTITAKDASKEYDGSALTESGITVEGLAETDTHIFKVDMTSDSAITNPGTRSNVIGTVDGVAVEPGKETAVGNYLVTVKNGTLTITGNGPISNQEDTSNSPNDKNPGNDQKPSEPEDDNQTPQNSEETADGGNGENGNNGRGTTGGGNNGGTNTGGGNNGGGNNGGTNTGGGNGAAAANAAAAPAAAPAAPAVTPAATPAAPAVTEVPDNQVPQAAPEEVTIDDEPAPQAAPEEPAVDEEKAAPQEAPVYWALLNLLMAIGSVLLGAGMLAAYFADRDRTDGDKNEEEDLSGEERKRRGIYRLACAVPAAASLIVFFLTEDLSRQMRMADKWTPLMVVFLAATAALAFLSGRNKEAESEEV